jgi:hypothetical protein
MRTTTRRTTTRRTAVAAGVLISGLALAGCTSNSGTGSTAPDPGSDLQVGNIDLSGACPENIVIQTDWNPESEHGHLYQLLGDDYTVDAGNKSVSGPLMAGGEYTGVNVEIRSGGPAIGFSTVSAQMYQDDDITLGYVNTDESVQLSTGQPTTAVFAPLEKNPQMIMWDPETYPDVTSIADLKDTDAVVRYFGGSAWMEYLLEKGILSADQVDGSYDGTPANFVAAGGKDAQQGFASAEPYIYENEVADWMKPVDYQLIDDAGWKIYQAAISVKTADLEELSPCLTELVPVLQQAEVDFFANPVTTTDLILKLVEEFDTGWVYSQGVADYSVKTMIDDGIVSNGDDGTIGDFDEARVQQVFDESVPLFTKLGNAPVDGLTAEDLYTNEFIDDSIGLAE